MPRYTLDQLESLTGLPRRTLRYYMQIGLVDRPIGETRAAYYTDRHLEQFLRVRRLSEEGVSLERIRNLMAGGDSPVPLAPARPGAVRVLSHVHVAPGLELQVDPEQARLSPAQLRHFVQEVINLLEKNLEDH
ncbi:MAG TPA: helix-turn-helix domain-containing protein [Ottowia sp.]|nr:helix-turn-helix domain-containing protein [Ottowia sp.]